MYNLYTIGHLTIFKMSTLLNLCTWQKYGEKMQIIQQKFLRFVSSAIHYKSCIGRGVAICIETVGSSQQPIYPDSLCFEQQVHKSYICFELLERRRRVTHKLKIEGI